MLLEAISLNKRGGCGGLLLEKRGLVSSQVLEAMENKRAGCMTSFDRIQISRGWGGCQRQVWNQFSRLFLFMVSYLHDYLQARCL